MSWKGILLLLGYALRKSNVNLSEWDDLKVVWSWHSSSAALHRGIIPGGVIAHWVVGWVTSKVLSGLKRYLSVVCNNVVEFSLILGGGGVGDGGAAALALATPPSPRHDLSTKLGARQCKGMQILCPLLTLFVIPAKRKRRNDRG